MVLVTGGGFEAFDAGGGEKIMLERVVIAIIIFAGGDFGGGLNADIAVMPSFVESGRAGGVNVERFGHGAASPSSRKTVDEAILIRICLEPLPFKVFAEVIGVENRAVGVVNQVAGEAGVVI